MLSTFRITFSSIVLSSTLHVFESTSIIKYNHRPQTESPSCTSSIDRCRSGSQRVEATGRDNVYIRRHTMGELDMIPS
jgi:hypothetical protein